MNEQVIVRDVQGDIPHRMFAKFGDGPWYAIPPGMEEMLRKAGAKITGRVVQDSNGAAAQ